MSIDLYVTLLAILRNGLVATFLDPSAGLEHVRHCCRLAPPSALVATPRGHLLRIISAVVRRIPRHFVVGGWAPGAQALLKPSPVPAALPLIDRRDDDPAPHLYLRLHRPAQGCRAHARPSPRPVPRHPACAGPPARPDRLSHAPHFALANLAAGVTTLIADCDLRRPGAIDPQRVLHQMSTHRPTCTVASPAFFERLLSVPDSVDAWSSLQHIHTGGGPVFPAPPARTAPRRPRG